VTGKQSRSEKGRRREEEKKRRREGEEEKEKKRRREEEKELFIDQSADASNLISDLTMSCNNRMCNSMQHGLADWMKQKLASCYQAIERQHLRIRELDTESEQLAQQLTETEGQLVRSEEELEDVTRSRDEMVRHVVQSRLGNRLLREQLSNGRALIIQQSNRIIELEAEGKALARALRANQEAARYDSGWVAKKAKKE
jgi:hypothetical protein